MTKFSELALQLLGTDIDDDADRIAILDSSAGVLKWTSREELFDTAPSAGFVTPYQFGAVGDGTTDDSDALEAAFLSERRVYFDSLFRATRTLNVEMVLAECDRPEDNGIIWDSGVGTAMAVTPTRFEQISNFRLGWYTQGLGVDDCFSFDWSAFTPSSRVGADGIPRQFERLIVERNIIAGENSDFDSAGWRKGIVLDQPWSVTIRDNQIFGYAASTAQDETDWVAASRGVEVINADESADFRSGSNKIYGFHTAQEIDNVEAITLEGREDVQLCWRALRVVNTTRVLNQINLINNHYAVSGTPAVYIEGARQVLALGNQFDYAQGRTDTADVSLVKLQDCFRFTLMGNVFRAGSSGTITVYAHELEGATFPISDGLVIGNRYEDINGAKYLISGDVNEIARITDCGNTDRTVTAFCSPAYSGVGPFVSPLAGNDDTLAYGSQVYSYDDIGAEETLATTTGTTALNLTNEPQVIQYFADAGAGAYTRNIDLRTDTPPKDFYNVVFLLRFAASTNPTIRFRNGSGGTLINFYANGTGTAQTVRVEYVFDGTDWNLVQSNILQDSSI